MCLPVCLSTLYVGACVYDLCPGPSSSCMTTKELQQHWGAVKHRLKPVKLLFEIPSARTIAQHLSKYVVSSILCTAYSKDCQLAVQIQFI